MAFYIVDWLWRSLRFAPGVSEDENWQVSIPQRLKRLEENEGRREARDRQDNSGTLTRLGAGRQYEHTQNDNHGCVL